MTDRPILFSGPMVQALLDGRKTQTRRVMEPQPPSWVNSDIKPGVSCMTPPGHIEFRGNYTCPNGINRGPACKFLRPPYAIGDRLWVRENFRLGRGYDGASIKDASHQSRVWCCADESLDNCDAIGKRVRPSIHMPRWASRLTLTVTDVRAQRVQDISEADALAEGVLRSDPTDEDLEWHRGYAEEHGFDPDQQPMQPIWYAPGTRRGFGLTKDQRNQPLWGPSPEVAFHLLWDSINAKRGFGWTANPWVWAYTFTVERRNIDEGGTS